MIEVIGTGKNVVKGYIVRYLLIVEEACYPTTFSAFDDKRPIGRDINSILIVFIPDSLALARRYDYEFDAELGDTVYDIGVYRSLRKPDTFRIAFESCAEIGYSPVNLNLLILSAFKCKDRMIKRMSYGVSMSEPLF